MPKVQITVEATGLVDVEMTDDEVAALEARAEDFPISIDELSGINMDDVLNQLDFEVNDFHVVRPKKARNTPDPAETAED